MLLSNVDIFEELNNGNIKIEPFDKDNLGPDSYDIRLGKKIMVVKKTGDIIDPKNGEGMLFREVDIDSGNPYVLKPNEFILAQTYEKIGLSHSIAGQLEGRSSIGRLGIIIHMTAGLIHAGWGYNNPNVITLEISSVNPNPIKLHYKMKIAQLSFIKLKTPTKGEYKSRYYNQKGPIASKIHHDYIGE